VLIVNGLALLCLCEHARGDVALPLCAVFAHGCCAAGETSGSNAIVERGRGRESKDGARSWNGRCRVGQYNVLWASGRAKLLESAHEIEAGWVDTHACMGRGEQYP
jgi:hypothetical protein